MTPARPPPRRAPPQASPPGEVVLPYRGDGRSLDVEVAIDGPDYGDRFRMIFDTGASFTTLTPEAIERIDIRIPADAPRVTLNTAGGEIQAPLVLLDAVWLGEVPVEWVTVAVCPTCAAPGRAGLLGLNVTGQFRVEIDHGRKRIQLTPRPGDRRTDVRAWATPSARGIRHGDGRLEMEVSLANRAPRGIERATVEIDCGESGFAVEIDAVPAKGSASTVLEVDGDGDPGLCETFRLHLLSAHWQLDRF